MLAAKVSTKGQATVPAEIRKHLKVKPGDVIGFAVEGERVIVRKLQAVDAAFLKLSAPAFDEWDSPEADEAFRDL